MLRGRLYDLGPYPALVDADDPEAGWVAGHVRASTRPTSRGTSTITRAWPRAFTAGSGRRPEAGRVVWVYSTPAPPRPRPGADRPLGRAPRRDDPCRSEALDGRRDDRPAARRRSTGCDQRRRRRMAQSDRSGHDPPAATGSPEPGATTHRPVPDRPAPGARGRARLRHPRRLRADALQDDRGQPDPGRRDDPRGQRGVRRRRLRPAPRAGLRLRDLLRRRPEPLQQHRRGLRREVAGDRARRARRACASGRGTRSCTTRSRGSRPSTRSSRRSPWRRRCSTTRLRAFGEIDRVFEAADALQAAGLHRDPARPGLGQARGAAPAPRRAPAERPRGAPRGGRRGGGDARQRRSGR